MEAACALLLIARDSFVSHRRRDTTSWTQLAHTRLRSQVCQDSRVQHMHKRERPPHDDTKSDYREIAYICHSPFFVTKTNAFLRDNVVVTRGWWSLCARCRVDSREIPLGPWCALSSVSERASDVSVDRRRRKNGPSDLGKGILQYVFPKVASAFSHGGSAHITAHFLSDLHSVLVFHFIAPQYKRNVNA